MTCELDILDDLVVIGAPDAPDDDGYGAAVCVLVEANQRVLTCGAAYHQATDDRKRALKVMQQRYDVDNKRIAALIDVSAGAVWKATCEPRKRKKKDSGKQES